MSEVTEEQLLSRTVMRFAMSRFQGLARDVSAKIQGYPPSAMFDGTAANLWESYCSDQQCGPALLLEPAWSDLFAPHLREVVGGLDRTEAALLTFYCCWDRHEDPLEIIGDPPTGVDEEALAAAIMAEVSRLALDHELLDDEDEGENEDWSDDEEPAGD